MTRFERTRALDVRAGPGAGLPEWCGPRVERHNLGAIANFPERGLTRKAYSMTFQWHGSVPHLAKVRGWTITPSHFLNSQLDTGWLSE